MISRKLGDKNEAPQASTQMLTNMPNGLIVDAKLEKKNSWIIVSRELGNKSEASHVPAKLQNKNSWIMILGKLGDKSER